MKTLSLLELTTRLVSFPTVSDSKDPKNVTGLHNMAGFIVEYAQKCGFQTTAFPHPNGKLNVVATLGGSSKPGLALSGHMDTVPYADWKAETNPLNLAFREIVSEDTGQAVYYGRGVADMKLFIAYMLKVAERLNGTEPAKPLALYFTCDEEIGSAGAQSLIKASGFQPAEYIIVGEPTKMLPVRTHKGYVYFKIAVTSDAPNQQSHSSDPTNSINTLEHGIPEVTDALVNVLGVNLKKIQNEEHRPPYATLNLGHVVQSPSATKNIIPETLEMHGEVRTIAGQDPNAIMILIEQLVRQVETRVNATLPNHLRDHLKIRASFVRKPTPAMLTPAESKIVMAVEKLVQQTATDVPYSTDGGVFSRAGAECVIWGPGDILQAHKPGEYVTTTYFEEKWVELYLEIIKQFCYGGE